MYVCILCIYHLSVLAGLERSANKLSGSKNVDTGAPARQRVTIHSCKKTVRDYFEELFWAEVWLEESLTDTIEEFSTGSSYLKLATVLSIADAIVGTNNRFVFCVADFVEACNHGCHKVGTKSKYGSQ